MINLPFVPNSVLNQFIAELRNIEIQKDSMRFRKNLERVGAVFAYEISKSFRYEKKLIKTPLGESEMLLPVNEVVLATIMRAGLPLHNGMLSFFDNAQNAFISAFRKYHKDSSFDIQFGYLSSPLIDGKTLIISDPMLATGSSMVLAYQSLLEKGQPEHTHIVSVLASKEGVKFVKKNIPEKDYTLWLGAIDDELTAKAFIVPGLGDAGDLAYGPKE